MTQTSSPKVAMLVANGFDEIAFTTIQKLILKQGGVTQVISSETAMANGWAGNAWGCFYPVDAQLNTILAYDFDALVVPGDKRSMERLSKTAHTKRIIDGFIASGKPVLLTGGMDIYTDTILSEDASVETVYVSEADNTESFQTATVNFLASLFKESDTTDEDNARKAA